MAKQGKSDDPELESFVVAAPLLHGSNPNSNAAGRRREDDFNLVTAFHQTQDPIHGDEFSPALGETSIGMGVGIGASVRRLTPTECMRLQGLPDDWFDGVHSPDSRVYAGLGDAVTATVGHWLGGQIIAAEAMARSAARELEPLAS